MNVDINLIKVTQDGEQVSVSIKDYEPEPDHKIAHPPDAEHPHQWYTVEKGRTLTEVCAPYFEFLDDRLFEMNTRVMAANEMVRALKPEEQLAIHNVSETLFGQIPNSEMNQLVQKARADVQKKELEHRANVEKAQAEAAEKDKEKVDKKTYPHKVSVKKDK